MTTKGKISKAAKSKGTASAATPNPNTLIIEARPGDDVDLITARVITGPFVTNANCIAHMAKDTVGELTLTSVIGALKDAAGRVAKNDMGDVEGILIAQAMVLNSMFGELTRKFQVNIAGGYLDAGECYLKMALKAQNQSRMTLETLGAIKNPPVVYAKRANIANGPQQVNNSVALASHAAFERRAEGLGGCEDCESQCWKARA